MKKILITGGAGYIGSHLVHHLVSKGVDTNRIIVLDNLTQGHVELIPKEIAIEICDLKNLEQLTKIFKKYKIVDVIHLAGSAYVGESMINPIMYFENNVNSSINLLKCCEQFNCEKFIFSSSCSVYGNQVGESIGEEHDLNPINPYGESKLIVERILDWVSLIGNMKIVSLRYFNVGGAGYGLKEKHNPETHIIPILLEKSRLGEIVKVYGNDYPTKDGTCERDFVHVNDLAEAHYLALIYMESMPNKREVFNLSGDNPISMLELIKLSESLMGQKISYEFSQRRKGDPPALIARSAKAREMLKWVPKYGLVEILKTTLDSMK